MRSRHSNFRSFLGPASRRKKRDLGAALVEAAFVAPFVVLLALGVFDTSYLLAHQNEVRAAAREGGRFAATNGGDASFVVAQVCTGFSDTSSVRVSLSGSAGGLGDDIDVTVVNSVDTITGFVDWAFNPPVDLSSTSTFRLESIPATWTDVSDQTCP